MKRKELIKKGIAGCMAALMTLSSMPVPPAYASDDTSTELDVSEEAAKDSGEVENDAVSEDVTEAVSHLSITPYVPDIPEAAEATQPEEDLPANVLKRKEERYGLDMQLTSDNDFPANSESWINIIQDGNQIQEYLGNINESILAKNNQQASGYILPIEISVFDSTDEDRKELKDLGKVNVNIETESAGEVNGYRLFHMKADKSWEELAFKIDGKNINFESEWLGKFIWLNVTGGDGDKVVADEAVSDSTGDGQQEDNNDITMTTAGELKDKVPGSEENKKNDISKDLTVNDVKPQEDVDVAGNEKGEKEDEKKAKEKVDEETGNVNEGADGTGEADKKENAGIAEGEEVGDAEGRDETGKEDENDAGDAESKDEAEGKDAGDELSGKEKEEKAGKELTGKEDAGNENADAEQAGEEQAGNKSDAENGETEDKEEDWNPDRLNEETDLVQTEAIPSGSVFDAVQNVNGVNVRVHAQAGVFPDGCSMQAEEVSNTEIQERVADAINKAEYQNPIKSYYYNITIYDNDGNEIEPDVTKGKVSVSFDMDELQDKNLDAAVYHIDDNFNADMLGSVNNSLAVIENGADAEENKVDARKEAGKEGAADAGEAADGSGEKAAAVIDESADEVAGDRKDDVDGAGEAASEDANAADEMGSADAAADENEADEEADENGNYGYDDNGSLMINSSMSDEGLTVSTNAFSFYAVSFTYNEKSYDMMAGEEVNLSTIKDDVGLSGDITNAVSSDESKLSITKEETTDSSGNTSVVWKAKPDEAFDGTATLTLTINNVDYVINVTVVNSYDKFALLFEDGTLIFVNKSRDLEPLIAEHGEITHKYVVSETGSKHDWNQGSNSVKEEIKKVVILDTIKLVDNASGYFDGCSNVSEFVGLENMDMSECTNMTAMFNGCSSLKEIDLSMWNVGKCQYIYSMFSQCSSIKEINLSGWHLDSMTNKYIFSGFISGDRNLLYINLSKWSLPKISGLFLATIGSAPNGICLLDMDNWRFDNMKSMDEAFYSFSWNNISIKNWDVSNVTSFNMTFQNSKIYKLPALSDWDVSNGKNFQCMFCGTNFESLDLSKWNMYNAENIAGMFLGARTKKINISNWHFKNMETSVIGKDGIAKSSSSNIIKMNNWTWDYFSAFEYPIVATILQSAYANKTVEFKNLTIKHSSTSNLCNKPSNGLDIPDIDVSGWSLPIEIYDLRNAFSTLSRVNYINCDDWIIKNNNSLLVDNMFSKCHQLKNVSINNWKHSRKDNTFIESATSMFKDCHNLNNIIFTDWTFLSYDKLSNMLYGTCDTSVRISFIHCTFAGSSPYKFIHTLGLGRWFFSSNSILDLSSSTFNTNANYEHMFADTNFETINLSNTTFIADSHINLKYMFADNYNLKNVITSNIHITGGTANITGMFQNAYSINYINITSFLKHINIKEAHDVFLNCYGLNKITCTGLRFSAVNNTLDVDGFFGYCPSLKNVDCSGWKSSDSITSLERIFLKMWTPSSKNTNSNSGTGFIQKITINNWSFPQATNLDMAFSSLPGLQQFICTHGIFNVSNAEEMLAYNSNLLRYDISGIDLSNACTLEGFFKEDNSLQRINKSDFQFMQKNHNVRKLDYFICQCYNLKEIDVSKWNTAPVLSAVNFAAQTRALKSLDLTEWNTYNIEDYGLDGFIEESNIEKIKLGNMFRFPKYSTFGLPQSSWNHVKDGIVNSTPIDLWNEYDGSDEMTGLWIRNLSSSASISLSDLPYKYSYNSDTNTILAESQIDGGQTVANVSFQDLNYRNVKIDNSFLEKYPEVKQFIQNGIFDDKTINFKIFAKANFDVASCSTEKNVIWTFDVPKDNQNIITIKLINNKTNEEIGYIQNSKESLDTFTQYDNGGNVIEVLKPGNRHTYKDLDYEVDEHDILKWNAETQKNDVIKSYYRDYKTFTLFKDEFQEEYNAKYNKILCDYIYPEYEKYISYNSSMNNYETVIPPGKYSMIIENHAYEPITLNPSQIITKTINKTDENGKEVTDENGNFITEEIPYEYMYTISKNIINKSDTCLTVFNNIYKETNNTQPTSSVYHASIKKVDQKGKPLSGAEFILKSKSTQKLYVVSGGTIDEFSKLQEVCLIPDENGNMSYGYISGQGYKLPDTNEEFYGYEIKSPRDYEKTCQTFNITFRISQSEEIDVTNDVIYNDGTTISENDQKICNTCMTYENCTCKKFGHCICECCGVEKDSIDNNLAPLIVENTKETNNSPSYSKIKITKKIDNKNNISNKIKSHTLFTFSVYDTTVHNRFVCSKTIKGGESFTLGYDELDLNHKYRIVEESFYNDIYMPKDNSIVNTNSSNAKSYYWNSDKPYLEFEYEDTYDKEYTFTNHYNQQKHNITVEKHLTTDNSANKDTSTDFNFMMRLTNPLLSLSDFEITYQKSDGSSGKVTLDSDGKYTFTLKGGQTIKFLDVPDVTKYTFIEEKSGIYHTRDDGTANGMLLEKDANVIFNNDRIDIINLPKTGGDGNTLPYAMLFIVTVSLVAAAKREKKKQKR